MILTIQDILNSKGQDREPTKLFKSVFGDIDTTTEIVRKQYPDKLVRFEDGESAMVGVITDLRKDRDNEVVLPEGMDDRNYSGIVLWQHDYWREDIPHARSMWRQRNPKADPYEVLAKTQYLDEISVLGYKVFSYRKADNPLGQSIGFRSIEKVKQGQDGYQEVYDMWKQRCRDMLKEKGIRATPSEFEPPSCFFTKWELWEYSDVYIPSNPNAVQIAVAKGILAPDEAKDFVIFDAISDDDEYVEKPYQNEHACRLIDPGQFDEFARKNCEQKHENKCIDVIYGIKDNKSKIQALRYPKKEWMESAAKAHCKDRGGTFEAAAKSADEILLTEKLAELQAEIDGKDNNEISTAELARMWDADDDKSLEELWAGVKLSG